MQREVDDGRTRLSLLSDTPGITKGVSFTQPKILLLWADIIKSNFSAEERESLKVNHQLWVRAPCGHDLFAKWSGF